MMVATRPTIIATGPQSHGTGARSLQLAGKAASYRQAGRQHLLLEIARPLRAEFILEQASQFAGFHAQHLGQYLGRIAIAIERRFDTIDLFRQDGISNRFGDRFLTCLAGQFNALYCPLHGAVGFMKRHLHERPL
jgi:hypothetical protein